jgi:hypothetical protein
MSLVTVYRSFNPADAHLVRSRLEAANLHATVTHELSSLGIGGASFAAGGVLVQVPENEAEEARELIAAKDSG